MSAIIKLDIPMLLDICLQYCNSGLELEFVQMRNFCVKSVPNFSPPILSFMKFWASSGGGGDGDMKIGWDLKYPVPNCSL